MINLATITAAVETLLKANTSGYNINRNAARNEDPNLAARTKGWINVQRGGQQIRSVSTGARPWMTNLKIRVEIQVASLKSGQAAEDALQAAETEIMNTLNANRKLGGTVDQTLGYAINYEFNDAETIWHHAAIITIEAEVRA